MNTDKDIQKKDTVTEENKSEEQKVPGTGRIRFKKIRPGVGIALVVCGIILIVSVILVPLINRNKNDKDIADIRAGKYADKTKTVSADAVSSDGVSADALSAEAIDADERMKNILADNSRIGIVEIDKIDVLYAIVEGTEDEQINRAIGHLTESAGIGEVGNCVIAGHRGGYFGTFFERLPELETGDEIVLTDRNGKLYYYVVYNKKMVDPADWSVTKPLDDQRILTLITCEDDTRKRIVVSAVLYQ